MDQSPASIPADDRNSAISDWADDTAESLIREARAAYDAENFDAAIQACERLLAIRPNSAEALLLLGLTSHRLDEPQQAIDLLRRAQEADPQTREYADALACVLAYLGDSNESLFYAKLATVLAPHPMGEALLPAQFTQYFKNLNFARPHIYRTRAEAALKRGDAASALSLCETQLEMTPGDVATLRVLARALRGTGRLSRAVATMHAVIHEAPTAEDYRLLAECLDEAGRTGEALFAIDRAIDRNPASADFARTRVQIVQHADTLDRERVAAAGADWFARFGPAPDDEAPVFANPREADRPLRVGYVGAGLHAGPLAGLLGAILSRHDPAQVEAYLYPTVDRHDATSERLARRARRWTRLDGIDPDTAATIMRGDGIDIAVDLTGFANGSALLAFAFGAAPVRLAWLGGGPAVIPAHHAHLLAEAGLTQGLPALLPCLPDGLPPASPSPWAANGHPTIGIVAPLASVESRTLALCARIMGAVPATRLLIANTARHDDETVARLYELASHAGLRHRTIVAELDDPDARAKDFFAHIDLAIDPVGASRHRETCAALAGGVPVLCLSPEVPGLIAAGRILTGLGLDAWVAPSPDELARTAADLLGDREALAAQRAVLGERLRTSELCDVDAFTRRLEATLRAHWRRWCAGA